jgi:hypothetical protein
MNTYIHMYIHTYTHMRMTGHARFIPLFSTASQTLLDLPHTAFTPRGVAMLMHIFSKKAPRASTLPAKNAASDTRGETASLSGKKNMVAPAHAASEAVYASTLPSHGYTAVILHLAGVSLELPHDEYNAQDVSNVLNSLAFVFPVSEPLGKTEAALLSRVFSRMADALMGIQPQDMGSQVCTHRVRLLVWARVFFNMCILCQSASMHARNSHNHGQSSQYRLMVRACARDSQDQKH